MYSLTPEAVQAAAYKYLSSDQLTIAVAGPAIKRRIIDDRCWHFSELEH
jgi:predicted Zn-dependent peptidase